MSSALFRDIFMFRTRNRAETQIFSGTEKEHKSVSGTEKEHKSVSGTENGTKRNTVYGAKPCLWLHTTTIE
ncbi:CLUMA_CG017205, isoform A [Clunio marinus]|uniref:CLUMA_CG017205, isoform A n=1 Tax=Clunio marinus TaxID=568069 RepID=A0A1J1IV13_9DIPT|nr:CLUMA_CG017205, isoform A [Clunio marinus]